MKRQSTSKLLRLMVAVFALFLLVMAGSVLSACGGTTVSELHKHTYGQPEHKDTATCGATGYDVYTCTECGDKYAIVTAATGKHTFENGVCKVCGISTVGYDDSEVQRKLQQILDKINANAGTTTTPGNAHTHDFKEDSKLNVSKTCLTFGLKVGKCECGSTAVLELIPAEGHKYSGTKELEKIAPTCTTDGQIKVTCDLCHDEFWMVDPEARALGHDFKRTSTENDKEANCITPSLRAYTCAREGCGEKYYEEYGSIDSTRHGDENGDKNSWVKTWTEWTTPEEGAEDTIVADALKTKPEDYEHSTSTLRTFYGKCEKCGQYTWKQETVNCEHEWERVVDEQAPKATCETDGMFNAKCTKCGVYANQLPKDGVDSDPYEFEDEDAIKSERKDVEEKAFGHKYDENLKENYEVDRENGKVVTDSDKYNPDGTKKTTNTTHWFSTTCENCDHEIVVAKGEGDAEDIAMYLYRDRNQKPDFDNPYYKDVKEKVFPREWHSWQLYEGTEVKLENNKVLKAPEGAKAPVEATCLDHGLEWYYCIDESCKQLGEGNGRWISIDLLPLGHDWDLENPTVVAPTCTKAGSVTYVCKRTNGKEGDEKASRCGHHKEENGKVVYDTEYAVITFKIDETQYNNIIKGVKKKVDNVETEEWETEPFNWKKDWRPETKDAEGEVSYPWTREYLDTWGAEGVWTTVCGKTSGTTSSSVTAPTSDDKTLCGENVLVDFTDSEGKILDDVLQKFMPQAHIWVVDEEAMKKQPAQTCYDGHVTIYKCNCKLASNNCCTDETPSKGEDGKCPKWEKEGKLEHVQKTDDKNNPILNTDTFTIYGYCGTNHTADGKAHKNYKVTYCIYCYAIIKVEETGEDNYRHFPFDREQLFGIMLNTCPLADTVTLKQVMENPKLLQEVATAEDEEVGTYVSCQEPWQREERKLFVEAWKGIDNYWFHDEGTAGENNVIKFLRLRDNNLECFDCYNHLDAFNTADEIMALAETYKYDSLNWALYYYVKGENGEMIRITEDNRKTLNSCEYKYYSQYKIWKENDAGETIFSWYSTMRDMTKTDWDSKTGSEHTAEEEALLKQILGSVGKYKAETVDANGKEFAPDGKHYLVPAKDYWDTKTHKNFKLEGDTVTMDWVCVFCGETFELQVKYNTVAAADEASYKANVVLANEDDTKILLVDTKGVKFTDTTLNQRNGADEKTLMQISGPIYAEDLIDGDTTNKNGKWTYLANGTVIITHANGSTGICVAHRQTNDWEWQGTGGKDKDYFEDEKWGTDKCCSSSLLRTEDFVDLTTDEGKELYSTIWADTYSTAGIDVSKDTKGEQRLEVAKRLDNLFREGGEIVVGGDLQELRKRDSDTGDSYKWDTITPAAVTAEADGVANKIFPLATLLQTGGTYISEVKNAVEGSKSLYIPLLLLGDGTTIDLNGHTLYANIWVGQVNSNAEDVKYANDGYGHELTAGDVTIKNGNIVMSPAARIQVEGKDAHLTLEDVTISGATDGICAFNGATITVKNSSLITKDYALSANNCLQDDKGTHDGSAGQGSANFELENSAFISTDSTAFFMPAKGNVSAKDCEFYGYNMGVYLRGHDLEEKAAQGQGKATHAIFENCLFAKGDQASGYAEVNDSSSGTETKHYGAFTVGNDNAKGASYGSILKLVLRKCDFQIIHVEKIGGDEEADETAWTPGFEGEGEGKDHCDLDLGANNDNCAAHCPVEPTEEDETACTAETCCHRAIVLNIFGCSELGEGCMTEDNKCNEKCGGQNATTGENKPNNGRLHLVLDETTFKNLKAHAATCLHEGTQGTSATKEITNPFLGCTFTDGEALKGQCKKLLIEIEKADGTIEDAGVGFSWLEADKDKTAQANA